MMMRSNIRNIQQLQVRAMSSTVEGEKLFDKILIANRGEIACRVIRTARKLGIKTVAIYSEPDAKSQHVREADEAYLVGPAASAESYLNIPKIMEVIKESGSQAVHPGYGFLSENMLFAQALEEANVAFIGPGQRAIKAMGDKIESKELALAAQVSCVPGVMDVIKDEAHCVKVSNEIGYPVMVKASAGGGGKGMRIAWNDAEAAEAFKLSTAEAAASFGDDRLFVEKFVEEPRHIEIQVVGDSHGDVVALPERECSIQRRNQKVLEEAPSAFLDPATRTAMQEQAIALAKACDYKSAGTVEFLCDKNKNFYFLEMNTRLQVEHPITEMITGVDLVEQMIRVAAGHKLPAEWTSGPTGLPFKGWAHEARVYAEDPFRGFLPSIGRITSYEEPTDCEGVRCDSGIIQGSDISMHYDPMICKLCTYGEDRQVALEYLEVALDNYVIQGVGHNIPFLRDVLRSKRFQDAKLTTNYIPEEYPDGFHGVELTPKENKNLALFAAMMNLVDEYQRSSIEGAVTGGSSSDVALEEETIVIIGEDTYKVAVPFVGDEIVPYISVNEGGPEAVEVEGLLEWGNSDPIARMVVDGEDVAVQFGGRTPNGMKLTISGATVDVEILSPKQAALRKHMIPKPEVDMGKWLVSPMPGKLISVAVQVGEKFEAGQELAVVEAMKMQNVLRAEKAGVVKAVLADPGATLKVDEEICEFE